MSPTPLGLGLVLLHLSVLDLEAFVKHPYRAVGTNRSTAFRSTRNEINIGESSLPRSTEDDFHPISNELRDGDKPTFHVWNVPEDGNCLFYAIHLGFLTSIGYSFQEITSKVRSPLPIIADKRFLFSSLRLSTGA